MTAFLVAVWDVVVASAPYLLLGLLIAGLVKVLLPSAVVARHLGGNDWRSVSLASLVGAPLPLCSCSVVPTAAALRRRGASPGATTSFLIATPETGVDSIGITWALFDPLMTIARPLAAVLTAVGAGGVVNALARARPVPAAPAPPPEDCCGHTGIGRDEETAGHEHEGDALLDAPPPRGPVATLRESVRYGFGPLLADLTPWLLLGFLIAGAIAVLVPDDVFTRALPGGWPARFAMLVLGVPMYVCATASTPIAAALVLKGLEPGAALIFMLAGPATNAATLAVVGGMLGRRVVVVYVATIAASALLLGWMVDLLYAALALAPRARMAPEAHEGATGLLVVGSAIALAVLLAVHGLRLLAKWRGAARAT